jgi:hypothetical protein
MRAHWFFLGVVAWGAAGCAEGVGVELDGADEQQVDDVRVTGETYFAVRRDARRCPWPTCGGFMVSRVGASTTRCADGSRAPQCHVPYLEVAGLSPTQGDAVRAQPDGYSTRLVARGRLVGARLQASQVWSAPAEVALEGTLRLASRPTCGPNERCAGSISTALSNGRTTILAGVDLDAARGTVADRAAAQAALTTDVGIVTAGTLSSTTGGTLLRVRDFAAPVLPRTGPFCGSALREELAAAGNDLTFPSESDYPFETVERAGAGRVALTVGRFRSAFGVPTSQPIETRTLDAVFARLTAETPEMTEQERATARRFTALRDFLRANLREVQVFRFSTVQVQVYFVGRTACGDLAGLRTVSIET